MYSRPIYKTILSRLKETRRFLQVLAGPRQVGKTTLIRQVIEALNIPSHYASADEPTLKSAIWIEQQWEIGRLQTRKVEKKQEALLVLDEVQKVAGWSEIVKRLWDDDTVNRTHLKVVLLGSSPLLIQSGLTESLAGRFEIIPLTHWSFSEMKDAFDWNVEQFIYFGGYPGAAGLIDDEERWSRYIIDSLIETTISRDILLMTRVDKPALLRRLFLLGCDYSGQILSYQKMLGQLQDAGNTTTLAHYLELLAGAGILTGLQKFAGKQVKQRGSSPKLQVLNTALIGAQSNMSFSTALTNRDFWGRLVETAIGAHLVNGTIGTKADVFYWRERGKEVDFVLRLGKTIAAIEVKSGRSKDTLAGMEAFSSIFKPQKKLLIGETGISIEEFLSTAVMEWVG
ncbi:MAG: AAA family ATPase [Nitrospinae bacterium RIFCSPLOWO2_02_FULL_39_110]|nr:MAG: AAA family ATPase [Nitrospinae bacterium RIFCSPHIGHO2_02_39_11]OGV99736.1 MAG: AAA family ATPase [Nitrospinae bacterium RIFCSPHIGHO2_12_FULL_39_42]OGW06300.1 MAG: AAA family ATPase [Nitrospinae bacterium RIFCSPLOWO2_02_39_17]OGW07194.1 MAG: AAA family ATPase [Nitrospinae bacterium RIFCSPLOWO2_02_FULL_39_110]OGW07490.1 MAG: AAA family ATPase [Nitrospinae bacterium RIFCSPLOWO2_12_39_15]